MTSLPQQTIQQLEEWLKIMLSKYPADNVYRVMTERVPILAERILKEMDTRRENREHISQIIVNIDQQRCLNKIVYNKDINAFYCVLPNGQLQQQASDAILLPFIHDIPQEMHMHRFQILRAVKVKLTHYHLLEWTPSAACVNKVITDTQHSFGSRNEACYFMSVIGGIVLRKEDDLFLTNRIHLWHGPYVQEVIECIQQNLHKVHRLYTSFWNKVKRRMHHAYELEKLWPLYFPEPTTSTPLRCVKQSSALFFAVCAHCYRNFPLDTYWKEHEAIRPAHMIAGPKATLDAYKASNIMTYQSETINGNFLPAPNYLLLREIVHDYCDWLSTHSPRLPLDLVCKQDIVQYVQASIPSEATRGSKTIYRGSLHLGGASTVHDLFQQFCQETLRPLQSTSNVDIKSFKSTRQLHNNYIVWCRHYASSLVSNVLTSHDTVDHVYNDTHAKPWYCSYKLFEAFMERSHFQSSSIPHKKKYVPTTPRWPIEVIPHKDTWSYYLAQFEQCEQVDTEGIDLSDWIGTEYGIVQMTSKLLNYKEIVLPHSHTSSPSFGPIKIEEAMQTIPNITDIQSLVNELNLSNCAK